MEEKQIIGFICMFASTVAVKVLFHREVAVEMLSIAASLSTPEPGPNNAATEASIDYDISP